MAVAATGSVLEGKDWVGALSAKGLRRGANPFDGGGGGVVYVGADRDRAHRAMAGDAELDKGDAGLEFRMAWEVFTLIP